jgi:hypothetical protein
LFFSSEKFHAIAKQDQSAATGIEVYMHILCPRMIIKRKKPTKMDIIHIMDFINPANCFSRTVVET